MTGPKLHAEQPEADEVANLHRPRIAREAPLGWLLDQPAMDGERWTMLGPRGRPIRELIWSVQATDDGPWWHVSVASDHRLPSWDDLRLVKAWIIGDHYAYQVLPPAEFYVNENPRVLHIWAPDDRRPRLPEFSGQKADGSRTI